jgi:microcystin-dependent protein
MPQLRTMIEVQPAGMVAFFGNSSAPSGWLKCNGATVSRTTYSDLFAAIGTTYGAGDGSTTFGLPDLRGEFLRGLDDGRGVDSGRGIGTAQSAAFQSHSHLNGFPSVLTNEFYGKEATGLSAKISIQQASSTTANSVNTSTNGGAETRPRNVALLACIKF